MRINELARELEVKSGAVIDALAEMGVEGKKTHSSKLDPDEVERVKRHFGGSAASPVSKSAGKAAAKADEHKPKFDFSKISKPGDALKAITKKSPAAPEPPAIAKPIPSALAGAPPKAGVAIPKSAVTGPILPPIRPAAEKARIEDKPSVKSAMAAPPAAKLEEPVEMAAAPVAETVVENKPAAPVAPAPPVRRVIMPHSGPRPVYTSTTPVAQPPRAPAGVPERGKPIFQRARPTAPGAPSGRPGSGAGVKRPMHPTSPMRGGMRPPGGGLGLPPPPGAARPGARPAGRRPGGRYVERGTKEGPMKGFVPPRSSAAMYAEPLPITKQITITEGISVKDLAEKLDIRAKDLIARLLVRGVFATVNQTLDSELAKEMARHFGAETDVITFEEQVQKDVEAEMGPAVEMEYATEGGQRPPVVTIMGHVDHGKTSLLDAIRETDVAAGEAGGITQHIGAYKVRINKEDSPAHGREITFLDTPGHEAFTRMRARGAKVTDIVVLVVAADDGVMPQTLEAIDHATAAKVPIIVAVNKIDKPEAMPDRVKKQLGDRGLLPEEWGGTTVFVDVSAKKKINLDLLLEMICLVADIQKLKASPERTATGSVVEAKLDRGRGAVATILVQNGTLRVGDTFIVGNTFGKVRAMYDDRGHTVTEAGPSTPIEVQGLEGLPTSGDQLLVLADRDKAKTIAGYREQRAREAMLAKSSRLSLEGLSEQIKTAGMKELPIILKGDVQGSVEVLADTLNKLSNDQVKIKVLHTGAGAITETDVLLASASNAIIIGFNVRPERKAQELAEQEQVDIRLHSIIYELQDEMRKAMTGLLEPVFKETYLGRAEVRNLFKVPKVGTVAGCSVTDGVIKRDAEVRLVRNGVVVFKGKIGSLKRFKDDASEVRNGMECGISIANFNDEKVGDVMEAFSVEKFAGELNAVKVMAER